MDHEGITLDEISQTKKNIVCAHISVESRKAKLKNTESRMVVNRSCGEGLGRFV